MVAFTFSHIGIEVANDDDGHFETVEGNTNAGGSRDGYGVFHKTNRRQAPALVSPGGIRTDARTVNSSGALSLRFAPSADG